jgi:hypothetical protein
MISNERKKEKKKKNKNEQAFVKLASSEKQPH